MNPTIDLLRAELERLYSLDEMTSMTERLLGLDPEKVGGAGAKATFARALAERCLDGDQLDALVDVILMSKAGVDPRVQDLAGLFGREEIAPGGKLGPFVIARKLGESPSSVVYAAKRDDENRTLKVLRREACRDRRAVQRFLTANRMVGAISHAGLPKGLEAGESDGAYWVSYELSDGLPLSVRLARTGPIRLPDAKAILRGILEPLGALHRARMAHGNLKLENVLLRPRERANTLLGIEGMAEADRRAQSQPLVLLVDFGTDRLRQRGAPANGHAGVLAIFGSPKTIAPEQVRGQRADALTDVYAFGAVMYEVLSGKPVFTFDTATDAAFAHLTREPEPPSTKAPHGWVPRDVDEFVLSLLAKDPDARPKDVFALMDELESLGKVSAAARAARSTFSEDRLTGLVDLLIAAPEDTATAEELEAAIEEGADPAVVAEAFEVAAKAVNMEDFDATDLKKSLLYRAARTFDGVGDRVGAEKAYAEIAELDPEDATARTALDDTRRALGKYGEVVESLIGRSEAAAPGVDRARLFAEIGRLCATELEDPDQGILAYARALCETPADHDIAQEIERLAEGKPPLWNEVLATLNEGLEGDALSQGDRTKLLAQAASWYDQKLGRRDLALLGYKRILATEPLNEEASLGVTEIYRKDQQWAELVAVLRAQADAAGSSPRGRDLRAEAAELYEVQLNDTGSAGEAYAHVLLEDPGHSKAADGMARIAERTGDYETLVAILEQRVESLNGRAKTDALLKVAEVYEDQLSDLGEAEQRYEGVLELEPNEPSALKGLDRIYNRTSKYRELLGNLAKQVEICETPRQKINIYERMASLHDEEFLDHGHAAECLEEVLALDPNHDAALTRLARHYRALSKWDALQELYETHARVTTDQARRVELVMQRARVLAEHVGSPDRAIEVYEEALEIKPGFTPALEAVARMREQAGDARAALSAIEELAASAPTPEARAELWVRAARLLEGRGDRDSAIERYKRAIEENPGAVEIQTALRHAYAARGDAASVVKILERELALADGDMAKARLHGELARVLRDKLFADSDAERHAKAAIEVDPANADALQVLGDLAFENEHYVEATRHLEPLVGRATSLPKEDGVRALVRFVESYGRSTAALASSPSLERREGSAPSISESHPRIAAALQALEQIAPDDADALSRVARVMFDSGNMNAARQTYERLLDRGGGELSRTDRADAQWRLGEALRRSGDLDKAVDLLREAADADPGNPSPLNALARVYEQTGDWEEFARTKRRRLEMAIGDERFELLLEIGDVEFKKLNERGRAGKTYVAALEERPDDRKLLTKLMELYSAAKDWGSLVEVVLRLTNFVEDPKQRAKYMHTAAMVTARQLGEIGQSLEYYDRALEFDPTLTKAMDEAIDLRLQIGDFEGVERLLKVQLTQAKQVQDRDKIVLVLDRLGALYRKLLSEPELAIDAYEAAQAFEPEGKERAEILAELYASDVTQYLEKAVRAQAQMLATNPYRVESYKLLRRLYTEARRPDPAWCLCQALSVLNLAEADEERFYLRYRGDNAAPARTMLDEQDWTLRLAHADADPLVTRIFALIQPTIIRARTKPLEAMGYHLSYRADLAAQPYPVSQMLHYAQGVFGFEAPPVFQNPDDPTGLGFVHAQVPSILLGRAAFERVVPNQSLAFVAARHLAYFRPGYYVRHLVPTGTGLKAWLFAAIKLCVPQFPIAPDLQGQVNEALAFMTSDFQGVTREMLASTVSKLLQSGGAIDLKKWVVGIDLTADRAGFLLAHDLGVATQVMRATEDAASVPSKERGKEIVLFSVSEPYLELRERLGITVES